MRFLENHEGKCNKILVWVLAYQQKKYLKTDKDSASLTALAETALCGYTQKQLCLIPFWESIIIKHIPQSSFVNSLHTMPSLIDQHKHCHRGVVSLAGAKSTYRILLWTSILVHKNVV